MVFKKKEEVFFFITMSFFLTFFSCFVFKLKNKTKFAQSRVP